MKKILALKGIDLNMFGKREPAHHGSMTLVEIDEQIITLGRKLGSGVQCFQIYCEVEMVFGIHE